VDAGGDHRAIIYHPSCPGLSRASTYLASKTRMAGTSPAMTQVSYRARVETPYTRIGIST